MFKKVNEGKVESDEGFSVQIIVPELVKYIQNNRIFEFDLTYDPIKQKIYIYVSKEKELSELVKLKIKKNIKEAVKLLKGDFDIV